MRDTVGAAFQAPLPGWSASMVQEPAVTKLKVPEGVMVQTPTVAAKTATTATST